MANNTNQSARPRSLTTLMLLCAALSLGACAHQAPSIAHIHVGHAITGAHDTPGRVGYFTVAEQHARNALAEADIALSPSNDLAQVKQAVITVNEITNARGTYPLTTAVREAADHIEFAAFSDDASQNLIDGYKEFRATIEGVLYRGDLIAAFAQQMEQASDLEEARYIAAEVQRLARANLSGEDEDGDGRITDRELGIEQIAAALQALVAREDPPYVTVDRWYLFNLIRLPSGDWIFKRSGGPGSRGY